MNYQGFSNVSFGKYDSMAKRSLYSFIGFLAPADISVVNEINVTAHKKKVTLKYFKEVKDEVEKFFTKAEYIVSGKEKPAPNITAMNNIIDGCKTASDVLAKKTDFFYYLKSNNILEDDTSNYYASNNHKYNIEDAATMEALSKEKNIDDSYRYLKFLNYINILRKGNSFSNFEDIGYVLLTENAKTLQMSVNKSIRTNNSVPLAVSLSFLTNRFWFKLNKGFGAKAFPKTFNTITKAQIVLSSHLNDSVGRKYEEILVMYKNGCITQGIVKARIIDLRSQTRKPEDIEKEDVSTILDNLTEDNIERFIDEQELFKNKAKQHEEENIKLKNIIKTKEQEIKISQQKKTYFEKEIIENAIESKNNLLNELKNTKSGLEEQRNRLDIEAYNKYKFFKKIVGASIFTYYGIIIFLIFKLSWDIMELWIYIFSLIPIIFSTFILLTSEKSLNPKQFLNQRKEHYKLKVYKSFNFNIFKLDEFELRIKAVIKEIKDLKKNKTDQN